MKKFFKGAALLPDGTQFPFSSDDDYHKLDGIKINEIAVAARLNTYKEIQSFIDYLQILKCCIENKEPEGEIWRVGIKKNYIKRKKEDRKLEKENCKNINFFSAWLW